MDVFPEDRKAFGRPPASLEGDDEIKEWVRHACQGTDPYDFCIYTGTPVRQVCYFRLGNPAGFVIHERPSSHWRHILIGIGPLFVNTVFGLIVALLANPLRDSDGPLGFAYGALIWIAVSVAMHSFPSTGDAGSIWQAVWEKGAPISARLVGTPLVALIFAGAIGSFFWLDLLHGIDVVFGIPKVLHIA